MISIMADQPSGLRSMDIGCQDVAGASGVIHYTQEQTMILAIDTWLLPAIAAGSSSYLVSLMWEKVRFETSPGGLLAALLAALSFLMGGICAYYRQRSLSITLENNIIVMFVAGAITTFVWLLLRRYLPGSRKQE